MNVLFIEDEEDLSASGVLQMGAHGCQVTPAYDLAQARELLESGQKFRLVIADHRLPDGLGIQFVAEMKELYPKVQFVVVSGCLSDEDVVKLDEIQIPSYRKPLLYSKIVDKLRRDLVMNAPVAEPTPPPETEAAGEAPASEPEAESETPEPKRKKFFGLF